MIHVTSSNDTRPELANVAVVRVTPVPYLLNTGIYGPVAPLTGQY